MAKPIWHDLTSIYDTMPKNKLSNLFEALLFSKIQYVKAHFNATMSKFYNRINPLASFDEYVTNINSSEFFSVLVYLFHEALTSNVRVKQTTEKTAADDPHFIETQVKFFNNEFPILAAIDIGRRDPIAFCKLVDDRETLGYLSSVAYHKEVGTSKHKRDDFKQQIHICS